MKTTKKENTYGIKLSLCEHCAKPFKPRKKKRFCSNICRCARFNEENRDPNSAKAIVGRILQKNERILKKLCSKKGHDKRAILHDLLVYDGYNIDYYTRQEINPASDNVILWVYEYGLEVDTNGRPFWVHQCPQKTKPEGSN